MKTTGGKEAQSFDEMTAEMGKKRDAGLSPHRGRSLYKVESGEYQEQQLKELVSMNISELIEVSEKEKISLENTHEVKRRSIIYLRACEAAGVFPSSLGLARSLGYSDRMLRNWRQKKPNHPTSEWLELFAEACADILNQSALKNNCNSIVSIFLSKSLYGFRESAELLVNPVKTEEDYSAFTREDIARRYLGYEDKGVFEFPPAPDELEDIEK